MSGKLPQFLPGAPMPEGFIRCPVCQQAMSLQQLGAGAQAVMVCPSRHSFDIAKEGYLNVLMRAHRSSYHKAQFAARHAMISQSQLFRPLIALLRKQIEQFSSQSTAMEPNKVPVLDAGAGEGSFLMEVVQERFGLAVGLDIAKQGISLAARKYPQGIWIVGDLSRMPFHNETFGVVLNILSPAHYEEFDRVLIPEGIVLKVLPRRYYLEQLRDAASGTRAISMHSNHGKRHRVLGHALSKFTVVERVSLAYSVDLSREELQSLIVMTPLTWHREHSQILERCFQGKTGPYEEQRVPITIDLDIVIMQK